eukprot:3802182-Rhodomonas_salina.1
MELLPSQYHEFYFPRPQPFKRCSSAVTFSFFPLPHSPCSLSRQALCRASPSLPLRRPLLRFVNVRHVSARVPSSAGRVLAVQNWKPSNLVDPATDVQCSCRRAAKRGTPVQSFTPEAAALRTPCSVHQVICREWPSLPCLFKRGSAGWWQGRVLCTCAAAWAVFVVLSVSERSPELIKHGEIDAGFESMTLHNTACPQIRMPKRREIRCKHARPVRGQKKL